ncbi:MAG: lipocalin family protein [Gammaproteobacteria bacterium]|nr:lipocalin family protein [Gammaproteobacteria bacterium]
MKIFYACLLCSVLFACTGVPKGLEPVKDFDSEKYLGTWYEIARLDHKFERGLSRVQATYRIRDNGGIEVINRGYSEDQKQWQVAKGKAFLNGAENEGRLKVSFFGPFYGGYNILVLDPDYQYAMVAGPDRNNLWILARTKNLPDKTLQMLIQQAGKWGFATDELILVSQAAIE